MAEDYLLEVKDLFVEYKTSDRLVKAVNGVSFSLKPGETLGLVGETGAGKTTTARAIMGLVPNPPGRIVSGEILLRGKNLCKIKEKEYRDIRGKDLAMIFQDPMTSLNPLMSVGDQIMEVYQVHSKYSKAEATRKSQEMLEMVGIPGARYKDFPHQFSGGMKQRVMIAIALACNPSLLIADEPTTALDVTIQAQILNLINDLKKELHMAVILITHDLGVVAQVCDKVAIVYAGEIQESGTIDEVYRNTTHPYTRKLFGAIPDLSSKKDRLDAIPGLVPDPANLPVGCKFSPRCSQTTDLCAQQDPASRVLDGTHCVRCHLV